MSNETARCSPDCDAICAAATVPPAGPESTVQAACRAASALGINPPLDCMICGSVRPDSWQRAASRLR